MFVRFERKRPFGHGWNYPLLVLFLDRLKITFRAIAIVSGLLCKLFPKQIGDHYINVNMAHEFWKDVKIPLCHKFDPPKASWPVYFVWMICLLNGINTVAYVICSLLWDFFVQ